MPTVILELRPSSLVAGLSTDCAPQITETFTTPIWSQNPGYLTAHDKKRLGTKIHIILREAIQKLLVTPARSHIVIVEPPLCPLPIKELTTSAVLGELRAVSLAWLQYSVCACVSTAKSEGLIVTDSNGTTFVVPVYDWRELTALIQSPNDDEPKIDEIISKVRQSLPIDLRHLKVVEINETAWVGACVIVRNTKLKLLGRSAYLNGDAQIQDSLFNWS